MENDALTFEAVRKLPKTDLHCHLDGSVRIATILDLAKEQGVTLPASRPRELRELIFAGRPQCRSLADYLEGFAIILPVMQTKAALLRIARELVEDCADEGVVYVEVRFCPALCTRGGLTAHEVVTAVAEGLAEGERRCGTRARIIVCAMRSAPLAETMALAELAIACKDRGVVAFDLCGDEARHPAAEHKEAFAKILKNGLHSTVHAGEAAAAESIRQAVFDCGAERIGHGTRLFEDAALLAHVKAERIALEVCLTSNVQTGAVRNLVSHPLRSYDEQGVRITVNTDNRLVSGTTVSQELWAIHQHYGFAKADLLRLIQNGFDSAFDSAANPRL